MTKITIDRSVVEQALEALEKHQEALRVWPEHTLAPHECVAMDASGKAITALRAALAEPVQEPQRTPLHEDEIHDLLEAEFLGGYGMRSWDDDLQVFRLAEQAHGIKEGT